MASRIRPRTRRRLGRNGGSAIALLLLLAAVSPSHAVPVALAENLVQQEDEAPDPAPDVEPGDAPEPAPREVVISDVLGGDPSPVVIDTLTAATGAVDVWLRSNVAVDSLRLVATIEHGTVTISIDGAAADGAVKLPPTRKVTVTVSALPGPGTYRGVIAAQFGDEVIPVADLTAIRHGTYTVTGAAVTDGAIATSTERTNVVIPLTLESTEPEPTTVAVTLDQLVATTGEAVSTTVTGLTSDAEEIDGSKSFDVLVPGNGAVSFTLAADLPVVSQFVGQVRVKGSDGVVAYSESVSVTRTGDGTSSLTVQEPDATSADAELEFELFDRELELPTFGDSDETANVRFAMSEGNREDVQIVGVEVLKLARVDGDARESVDFEAAPKESLPLEVARNGNAHVTLAISGLDRPGRYEGTVSLATGTTKAVESDFVILVRRQWIVAFALVTLGVLVAALLRWLGGRRKNLGYLERTATLDVQLEKLNKPPPDGAAVAIIGPVHGHLKRRVEQVETKLERREPADVTAELTALETQITEVAPHWWSLVKDASRAGLLDEVQSQIAAVRDYLQRATADAAATTDAQVQLSAARALIASTPSIAAEVMRLRDEIDGFAHVLDQIVVSTLSTQLAAAEAANDATQRRAAVEEVGAALVRALVQHAIANLPPESPPPPGFANDDVWKVVRDRAVQALTAAAAEPDRAKATDAYETAVLELIDELRQALERAVRNDLATFSPQDPPQNVHDAAAVVREALRPIEAAVSTSNLGAAQAALEAASAFYRQLQTAIATRSRGGSHPSGFPATRALVPGRPTPADAAALSSPTLPLTDDEQQDAKKRRNKVRNRLLFASVFWTVPAVIVIGILGLQALWVNDTTWGDWNDLIIAFVWGLGLHSGTAVLDTAVNRTANIPGAA